MGTKAVAQKNGKKGGRPKGSISEETRMQQESMKLIKRRVFEATDHLLNAQMGLAVGSQYLFKIKTYKGQKSDPILVKSQSEIEAYLRGEYEGSDTEYYFMTTKDPDNRALKDLLDRTHGKAKESVEVTNPDGNLKTIIINKNAK